jgi:hypothetical protein
MELHNRYPSINTRLLLIDTPCKIMVGYSSNIYFDKPIKVYNFG